MLLPLSIDLGHNFDAGLSDGVRRHAQRRRHALRGGFHEHRVSGLRTVLDKKFTVYGEFYSQVNQGPDSAGGRDGQRRVVVLHRQERGGGYRVQFRRHARRAGLHAVHGASAVQVLTVRVVPAEARREVSTQRHGEKRDRRRKAEGGSRQVEDRRGSGRTCSRASLLTRLSASSGLRVSFSPCLCVRVHLPDASAHDPRLPRLRPPARLTPTASVVSDDPADARHARGRQMVRQPRARSGRVRAVRAGCLQRCCAFARARGCPSRRAGRATATSAAACPRGAAWHCRSRG